MTEFNELGLNAKLLQNIAAKGYDTPSPIQAKAIPLVLSGRDLMAAAQTGTGKTGPAFAKPIETEPNRPFPVVCVALDLTCA